MHTGYGAALGVGYTLVMRGRPRSLAARGLGYGVATWLFGSWLLLPGNGAKQAPWKKRPAENAVDLVAHLVFGAATALVAEELSAQPDSAGRRPTRHRRFSLADPAGGAPRMKRPSCFRPSQAVTATTAHAAVAAENSSSRRSSEARQARAARSTSRHAAWGPARPRRRYRFPRVA